MALVSKDGVGSSYDDINDERMDAHGFIWLEDKPV